MYEVHLSCYLPKHELLCGIRTSPSNGEAFSAHSLVWSHALLIRQEFPCQISEMLSGYWCARKFSKITSVGLIQLLVTIADLIGIRVGITEHFQKSLLQGLKYKVYPAMFIQHILFTVRWAALLTDSCWLDKDSCFLADYKHSLGGILSLPEGVSKGIINL